MYGHLSFNRSAFNRQLDSAGFTWTGIADAVATGEAELRLTKYMSAKADAVATGIAEASNVHYMAATGDAVASTQADWIRKRGFIGHADAVSSGIAGSVYAVGTDFLALEVNLHAGDDLVIDTERMTMLLNNQNAIYLLSDDSTFFELAKGDYISVSGSGTATVTLLWKDRWL